MRRTGHSCRCSACIGWDGYQHRGYRSPRGSCAEHQLGLASGPSMMIHYAMLLQAGEEHVTAGRIIREYAGFLSFFAVYGAVGFLFEVLKDLRRESAVVTGGSAVDRADRRAAAIGFAGAVLMLVLM